MIDPSTVLIITLVDTDLNFVKEKRGLGTNTSNTYVSVETGGIKDIAGNDVEPKTGLKAMSVVPDSKSPSLISFDLDMDDDTLSLTFDETIDASSLDGAQFTFQSARLNAPASYKLKSGTSSSAASTSITFKLPTADINEVKGTVGLAASKATTYLSLTSSAILDMNGNVVNEITSSAAQQVSTFTPDTKPVSLDSFDLDIDSGQLILSFSETIDVSTLSIGEWTFQNDVNKTISYTLSDSVPEDGNRAAVTVDLSASDLNEIKRLSLCSARSNCFLSFGSSAVQDIVGEEIVAKPDGLAVSVGTFTKDDTSKVMRFTL